MSSAADIDFYLHRVTSKKIAVMDNTNPDIVGLPLNIYSMTLNIESTKLTNGMIDSPIDLIAYMQTSREDQEIYNITSASLGLAEDLDIPDGVYTLTWNINGIYVKEHKFVVFIDVQDTFDSLVTQTGYSVNVPNDYDIEYVGTTINDEYSKWHIERLNLASALLEELKYYADAADETQCNDTLDKLENILEILNDDING